MIIFLQQSYTIYLRKHEFVILNNIALALSIQILWSSREYKNIGLSVVPR